MKLIDSADVLVMGAGPAALCITAELVQQGLNVQAIASKSPLEPWPNTYGIWASELESLNMQELLKYRWKDTVSFFGDGLSKKGIVAQIIILITAFLIQLIFRRLFLRDVMDFLGNLKQLIILILVKERPLLFVLPAKNILLGSLLMQVVIKPLLSGGLSMIKSLSKRPMGWLGNLVLLL